MWLFTEDSGLGIVRAERPLGRKVKYRSGDRGSPRIFALNPNPDRLKDHEPVITLAKLGEYQGAQFVGSFKGSG